jgi:exodeoxyribonuclease III
MLVATWNVNSLRVRLAQLTLWVGSSPVDVLALQEIKLQDEEFPRVELEALGFQAAWSGQKTYNGVAILARSAITDVVRGIPDFDDPQRRVLAATVGGVRVVNVYVPNGQAVGSEKYAYKLKWFEALHAYVEKELARNAYLVVLGDYNVAPEDRDVHDPAAWEGQIHVSPSEREALARLGSLGLADTFRQFDQPENSFSWWDYRAGAFRRNHGLRIDLIFASQSLARHCTACHIEREPRSWERPSDHAPVVARFDI